jgi:pyruvate, orthophosphate dikinase
VTIGFSRDDIGSFVADCVEEKGAAGRPVAGARPQGVGQLVALGIKLGRKKGKKLKVRICGEPNPVELRHLVGMDCVSCSPFRVPIARLAAAQAQLQYRSKKKG